MSRQKRDVIEPAERAPMDPEDVLRIMRRVGLGLLIASLFVDSAVDRFYRYRSRIVALQYRVVPSVEGSGVALADIAIEILGATSHGHSRDQ